MKLDSIASFGHVALTDSSYLVLLSGCGGLFGVGFSFDGITCRVLEFHVIAQTQIEFVEDIKKHWQYFLGMSNVANYIRETATSQTG